MTLGREPYSDAVSAYLRDADTAPLLLCGDAAKVLRALPDACVDCCITSPPYFGQREYADAGLGGESDPRLYLDALLEIAAELRRVLRPTGSLWLNIGDVYREKRLLGLPWRLAIALCDRQGWTLRNAVVWNKIKGGPDNARDRLRVVSEDIFHLVRQPHGYYYDVDAIRTTPGRATVRGGAIVSATGVRGVRYRRQIDLSMVLTDEEKRAAIAALDDMLAKLAAGELGDFRMILRGKQRATHSDSERVSGRAKELRERGFYFLRYHPLGAKPSNVWDILPEDSQGRGPHFAAYPEDLCKIPILATSPRGGVVLDPFCGTGTTNRVARALGRKSIGIDTARSYLEAAERRCDVP
jgi:site-specific DNA-methyltransferase (adenine-specific)